jgi:hypothetical protein
MGIGGSVHRYDNGNYVRFGNGVESDWNYDYYTVMDNYFYQIYDAAMSNQDSGEYDSVSDNITYSGNLIEYCTYGLEIFNGDKNDGHLMKNISADDNIIMYTGYGWGDQRPDKEPATCLQMWGKQNNIQDFVMSDNIFYISKYRLLWGGSDKLYLPQMSGNTYVQHKASLFATWVDNVTNTIETYNMSDANISAIIFNVLGDKVAKIVILD